MLCDYYMSDNHECLSKTDWIMSYQYGQGGADMISWIDIDQCMLKATHANHAQQSQYKSDQQAYMIPISHNGHDTPDHFQSYGILVMMQKNCRSPFKI